MSFQILDSNQNAISIYNLDREAAQLWGKPIDPKYYAYPDDEIPESILLRYKQNWFDVIGRKIHDGMENWDDIRADILAPYLQFPIEEIMTHKNIWGYVQLVDLWKSKGYIPKFIKE